MALFYKDKQDLADQKFSNDRDDRGSRSRIVTEIEEETEIEVTEQEFERGGDRDRGGKPKRRNENMTVFSLISVKEMN